MQKGLGHEMKEKTMKYVGIVFMILAHPVGYNFWNWVIYHLPGYPGNLSGFMIEESSVLVGVGILEIFFLGLALFLMGIYLNRKDK